MDESATATLTPPRNRVWNEYVTTVRADADANARVTTATDKKMVIVFVTVALALTCNNFLSDGAHPQWLERVLRSAGLAGVASRLHDAMLVSSNRDFNQLAFWAVVMIVTYVLPPVLVIRFVFRERIRDYGLRIRGMSAHVRVYFVLFGIAFPLLVAASYSSSFQERYPFYHPIAGQALGPNLYWWWLLYWSQFVALEFFFRGFMVQGLAPRLGWAAIFAMVVPYNMLHYGKPMPEALAAIVGGIVLGTLAMKTKSIWLGASLHISIALTMDLLALWHLGRVF
jgi:membrane protease YdiL (CAAX protease family)